MDGRAARFVTHSRVGSSLLFIYIFYASLLLHCNLACMWTIVNTSDNNDNKEFFFFAFSCIFFVKIHLKVLIYCFVWKNIYLANISFIETISSTISTFPFIFLWRLNLLHLSFGIYGIKKIPIYFVVLVCVCVCKSQCAITFSKLFVWVWSV